MTVLTVTTQGGTQNTTVDRLYYCDICLGMHMLTKETNILNLAIIEDGHKELHCNCYRRRIRDMC
jgi:hypothetical protein